MTPDESSRFHRRMEEVREDLLGMAGLVEAAVQDAFAALSQRDPARARRVQKGDRRIDLMENQIDEKALVLLATQQPVAVDLRFLSAALRICSFLERIGDQAVNLAWRALALQEMEPKELPPKLYDIYTISRGMVRSCLDALVGGDKELARQVIELDDEVDDLTRDMLVEGIEAMQQGREDLRRGVELILCSRHLERIADEATNIAEEVVFLVEGRVIRHGGPQDAEPSVGPL